uniref:Uncharacterized protein n=1 Tax=Plectus sambesii TaxID=2011161 RepID=A0A914WSA4_9BILA
MSNARVDRPPFEARIPARAKRLTPAVDGGARPDGECAIAAFTIRAPETTGDLAATARRLDDAKAAASSDAERETADAILPRFLPLPPPPPPPLDRRPAEREWNDLGRHRRRRWVMGASYTRKPGWPSLSVNGASFEAIC